MNEANKNEVDLLLRSFARGQNEPGSAASEHLDADELNAYAEGAVPQTARLRYMEHLADCSSCRGIVVGLTQAAGAVTPREPVTQRNRAGFWQNILNFFSSPALRYAVPALLLTVVIGIGLLVFKQQQRSEFVAQNQPGNATAPPTNDVPSSVAVEPSPARSAGVPAAEVNPTVEVGGPDRNKAQDKKTVTTEVPIATDSTLAKNAKTGNDAAPESGAGLLAQLQPPPAPAKAAAPTPASEVQKLGEFAREPSDRREAEERASRDVYKSKDDEDIHGPNRARNAPMPTAQGAGDTLTRRGGPSANKNNTNEVETRTVMGKRFTRGSAGWVDTEYESQAMTRISRGSERYRALVADEPGVATIAERLDGVVIVVWKGRAYRIQ
jgi:hypothetical protein